METVTIPIRDVQVVGPEEVLRNRDHRVEHGRESDESVDAIGQSSAPIAHFSLEGPHEECTWQNSQEGDGQSFEGVHAQTLIPRQPLQKPLW